ncbi:MAG: class I SAM-dependent methyltransferase [Candidatus Thorarchaeota archaeon]|jgi:ubiquinone/menaquinone biosynthesis C-methylase UbiE
MTNDNAPPDIDWSQYFVLPHQEVTLHDIDNKGGLILDVGGGGEGIIGLLKGKDVVAIDMLKEELTETENESLKVVMDARDLKFIDGSFTVATVYFTFMYIPEEDFETIFSEIWRVLKPGGEVLIWDAIFEVPPAEKEKKRFVVILKTHFPDGLENQTGYGGIVRDQSIDIFLKPAQRVGFKVLEKNESDYTFFMKLQKP